MGAIAELQPSELSVMPGAEAQCRLKVRNSGQVVDQFTFEPLGDAAGWITVEPEVVRLFPNGEETVTVRIAPPRSPNVRAGDVPMAVRVISGEDPAGSVVEEAILTIEPFTDVTAELLPRTSKGRRRAKHELAVDNRGNQPLNAEIVAFDEAEALDLEVSQPGLVAEPGTANFSDVKVKARKRFWRGTNKTQPFQVEVRPEGLAPLVLDGTMVQEPMLPKWTTRALLALLLLLAALVALWFAFLRPQIESAARDAVEEDIAALESENAAQDAAIAGAAGQAAAAETKADTALENQGTDPDEVVPPTDVVTDPEPVVLAQSFDTRLSTVDSVGGGATRDSITIGDDQVLELTDIFLENPRGHSGFIRVLRNGDVLIQQAHSRTSGPWTSTS